MHLQPKSTTILESKDLTTMNVAIHFIKIREYELELQRLKDEEVDKKKKGLYLKTCTSYREASDEDPSESSKNENMNFLVKKYSKFMKKKGRDKRNFQKKGIKESDSIPITYTCFECGKQIHIKVDCPTYLKKK